MPSTSLPPERAAEAQVLAQAIRQAIDAEVEAFARTLVRTDDQHLFGQNKFKLRDLVQRIGAKVLEQHLAQKNGYQGNSVTCAHCGRAAEFHSHRPHTLTSLVGPVGPLLRKPSGQVDIEEAGWSLGLTNGGNGLEGRLEENFPLVRAIILDFCHPAEKLRGLCQLLYPKDEAQADERHGPGAGC
jgi:hypothetical protein